MSPRGATSTPIIFNLYTADQVTTPHTSVAEFSNDLKMYNIHKKIIIFKIDGKR